MNRLKWLVLVLTMMLLVACSSSRVLPAAPGEYEIKSKSLVYDGRDYEFYWKDKDGQLRRATVEQLKMVEDQRTFLEMRGDEPIVHLATEEPVNVLAEDSQGSFSSMWFPFLLGQTMGSLGRDRTVVINQPVPGTTGSPSNLPTYHYPPTGTFGRDESLHGSVTSPKPTAPDYGKIAPAPYSVSGQTGGTGGGTAASGKSVAASGQSAGTGAGTAASAKGGFAKGQNSYRAQGGNTRGITGSSSGTSGRKSGSTSGSSTGTSTKSTGGSTGTSIRGSSGSTGRPSVGSGSSGRSAAPSSGIRGGGGGRRR